MSTTITGYQLTKAFFIEREENTEMRAGYKVHHLGLYTWICELRNRFNIEEVELPVHYTMHMVGIGSDHTLKKCIEDLEKWGLIEIVSRAKNQYQTTKARLAIDFLRRHCDSNATAMRRQSDSNAIAVRTTKTSKTVKTNKTDIDISETRIAFRDNVKLSQAEFDKLIEKYGQPFVELCLDKLSSYKLANGKGYDSDYGAINSWVTRAVQKDQLETGVKKKGAPPPPTPTGDNQPLR